MAQQPPRRRTGARALGTQAILLLVVLGCGAWLVHNVQVNLQRQGLAAGYDFLGTAAGFDISEGPVPFDGTDTYLRAFLAGAMNTLRAALPALALASLVRHGLGDRRDLAPSLGARRLHCLCGRGARRAAAGSIAAVVLPAHHRAAGGGRAPAVGSVCLSNAGLTLPALHRGRLGGAWNARFSASAAAPR